MTSDATASASSILSGYTAYVNGSKVTGNYSPPSPGLSNCELVNATCQSGWVLSHLSISSISSSGGITPQYITTSGASSVTLTTSYGTYTLHNRGAVSFTPSKRVSVTIYNMEWVYNSDTGTNKPTVKSKQTKSYTANTYVSLFPDYGGFAVIR